MQIPDGGMNFNSCPALVEKIDKAWEEKEGQVKPRPYLGISSLGYKCPRRLWLQFRWIFKDEKSGRMYRLLNVGHREEDVAAENLKMAGLELQFIGDNQMEYDFGYHIKGHPDGLILSGVPGAEKTKHIWENKTSNKKNFDALVKAQSVQTAKPEHYAQMQLEMLGSKMFLGYQIDRALYTVLCKDNSELYAERVKFDLELALFLLDRGKQITMAEELPKEVLSHDPGWFECKMCPAWRFCHQDHMAETVTCRSCCHSTPKEDGTWECSIWNDTIPLEVQYKGCQAHCFHPELVPWEFDSRRSTERSAYYWIDKETGFGILNGIDGIPSTRILEVYENGTVKGLSRESNSVPF